MSDTISSRDADAARYRAEGWTYQRIANELGFQDRSAAHKAVQRTLRSIAREATDEARHLALNALDEMSREAWQVLRNEHYMVSQGRVVTWNDMPLPDDAPVLVAIDRLLKIQERQAKLLGLDAPSKSQVEIIPAETVEAEIRRLEEEIARRAKAAEVGQSGES